MGQTFPATECIIVDDASTDDSIDRCTRLIADYAGPTRFKILHHSHNRGLSAARNTGIDAAKSKYVYLLDSDDEITPECLEKLTAPVLGDDTIEMVVSRYRVDNSAIALGNKNIKANKKRKQTKHNDNVANRLQRLTTNE